MVCKQHKWEKIDEEPLIGWWGSCAGKVILFQCKVCCRLNKVKLDRNDY